MTVDLPEHIIDSHSFSQSNLTTDDVGNTVADATDRYSYQSATQLSDGAYSLSASSAYSSSVSFTVGQITPTIYYNGPLLFGDATGGATVQVWNGSTLLGTTMATAEGRWQFPMTGLADGAYNVKAVVLATTSSAASSSDAIQVLHDTVAPASPTIAVEKTTGGDGLLYRLFGTAEAGSNVHVFMNGTDIMSTIASATGSWETVAHFVDGKYALEATAADQSSNVSAKSAALNVTLVADDFAATILTTGSLAAGGSAQGTLEMKGDKDWFKVSLDALTTYRFSLSGVQTGGGTLLWGEGNYPDVGLRLWDPQANAGHGAFVYMETIGSRAGDPTGQYSITRSGDYYLEAGATSQTGSYTVKALTFAKDDYYGTRIQAVDVAVGTVVLGGMQIPGDTDTFSYTLEAGKTYTMSVSPRAGLDIGAIRAEVGDTADSVRWYGESTPLGEHSRSFVATSNDKYYVTVSGSGNTYGGAYAMTLKAAEDDYLAGKDTVGKLAIGATIDAKFEVGGDRDWFKLDLAANTSYTFKMSGDFDYYQALKLFDAAGNAISNESIELPNGEIVQWTPSVGGTYFLETTGDGKADPYTLQAYVSAVDDYANSAGAATPIALDGTTTGHIEVPRDTDWFKVPVQAGHGYVFIIRHTGTDWPQGNSAVNASLYDGNGNSVASSSNYYSYSGFETVVYQAVRDGDYYFKLGSNYSGGMGAYTIETTVSAKDMYAHDTTTTGSIAAGEVIRSALDVPGDVDWIRVELVAGQSYRFELTGVRGQGGTLTTPNLSLGEGNFSSDNFSYGYGRGGDPMITLQATRTGTYYVKVGSNSQESGTYTLKFGSATTPIADTFAPVVTSVNMPTSGYEPGPAADLVFNFDEKVVPDTGIVRLMLADGSLVEAFDMATSTRVKADSYTGSIAIDPTRVLAYGTDYQIELVAGAVKDLAGLPLAATTTYSFRTAEQSLNLSGTSGNDRFTAGRGNDYINGGGGIDTVAFTENAWKDYSINKYGGQLYVNARSGSNRDVLVNVERLVFSDQAIAFDVDGAAGKVYRLYQAAFDRAPDKAGLGFWIGQVDGGVALKDVAVSFVSSAEFTLAYGANLSNAAYSAALYDNVLHRLPDQAGLTYWVNALEGGMSREDVLVMFSESAENQAALVGVIDSGIAYLP